MSRARNVLICGLLILGRVEGAPHIGDTSKATEPARRLTGKFLHITDFHPDPFYQTYSSTERDAACHHKQGPAGLYGAETSGCDSPYTLVNKTFEWIDKNIRDDIDFIVWTGDSARHDNDERLPRTQQQVIDQNEFMVSKFEEVFGKKDDKKAPNNDFIIPIVPTFGNNDVMPHNIFLSGPNKWTARFLDIWRDLIPEAQRHQFQQGGWFFVEVIPGKLAVVSLNTLYFFTSNSGVDGCADKREPGFEQMEWLRIQLQLFRERGIKAILMGHVPPARVDSKESWDDTCWQKYTLWLRQFRDVVVGSFYGHMNIDHFILQDFHHITKDAEGGKMGSSSVSQDIATLYEDGQLTVASASDYLLDLRQVWAKLPKPPKTSDKKAKSSSWNWVSLKAKGLWKGTGEDKSKKKQYLDQIGGKYAERYAVAHVAPSIVPTYFPSLRIIEYNITGLENFSLLSGEGFPNTHRYRLDQSVMANDVYDNGNDEVEEDHEDILGKRKKHKGGKKSKKYKFKVPLSPSKSTPPGPAYSPQTFTITRIVQYFANLTQINNDFNYAPQDDAQTAELPIVETSISTNDHTPRSIFGLRLDSNGHLEAARWKEGKHKHHQGKKPRQKPHPKEFKFEIEYDTKEDEAFTDLTVRRWVEYAGKIGKSGTKALQHEDTKDGMLEDPNLHINQGRGKKGRRHKGKKYFSKAWFTFVQRAFVGTMDSHEIEAIFGAQQPATSSEAQTEL